MSQRRLYQVGWHCFDVRWLEEPLDVFRIPNRLPVTTSDWFEQREAARFSLYTWDAFQSLSAGDRAGVVAYYRVYNKLNALIDQHQSQQAKLESQKHTGKGKR